MPKKNIMPAQEPEDEAPALLELVDGNGDQVLYELLDVVPYQEKEYIVVVPYVEGGDEVESVEIYEVVPNEDDDTETYVGLKTREEVEAVYQEFQKRAEEYFNFLEQNE